MDTTAQRPALSSLPMSRPSLRLLFCGADGIVSRPPHPLSRGATPIGRVLDGAGILLAEDRQVSRRHAAVHLAAVGCRVTDEGSRNGTFVNGRKVGAGGSELADGDVLRIGDSFLLFRHEPISSRDAEVAGLLGRAPAVRALRSAIAQVAPTAAMVLLLGESGSGKEVAATAISALSGRSGPLVAVNCSAIPESLAESHLFGHERGAFTGAAPHAGFFRAAHGGTLFLDEVGELTPAVQPKLLRALEEKAVVPVGALRPVPCDVRIIAATNRSLGQAVDKGLFRGDLLARLAEFTLALPPLRERREDILLLFEHALKKDGGQSVPRLHPDLVESLLLYDWPYNVRELRKTAAELRIRGGADEPFGPELLADRLAAVRSVPEEPSAATPPAVAAIAPAPAAARSGRTFARGPIPPAEELRALLLKHAGIVADIAKEVGRSRAQVYRWLEQRGLDPDAFRKGAKE